MVLDINSKDYNNLKTNYSDQNIINRLQGSEFLIDDSSSVPFDIIPNSIINSSGVVTPSLPPSGNSSRNSAWAEAGWYWILRRVHGRAEGITISGSFSATINEVIYDTNNISVDYEIDYDSYYSEDEIILDNNYLSNQFIYNAIRNGTYLVNKDVNNNRVPQILDNSNFDINTGSVYAQFLWANKESSYRVNLTSSISINNIVVNTLTGETTVTINFRLPLWYGYNIYKTWVTNSEFKNYLNVLNKITFKVRANTINTTENSFDYGDFAEDPYALESNEFLQYQNGEPLEDRMSYNVSQDIFEKTERNRMLVSFNLFRLDKLDWDGNGNLRFIRSRDRIKIKDELGNYLGAYYDDSGNEIIPEFEVVRANGKWDGKFYKEIIAKQVFTYS